MFPITVEEDIWTNYLNRREIKFIQSILYVWLFHRHCLSNADHSVEDKFNYLDIHR